MRTREFEPIAHLKLTSSNGINLIYSDKQLLKVKMDKVNGIDMEFIFKKRDHSPETHTLHMERNRIL